MTVHPPCGKTWTSPSAQHCPACCVTFVGTSAGDRHRVGAFHGRKGRRCVPEYLLTATGLRRDPRGIWGTTGTVRAVPEGWRDHGKRPESAPGRTQSAEQTPAGASGPTEGAATIVGRFGGQA